MSLTLGYFSKFPAAYKDREKSIGEVRFNNIHQDIIKDKIIIHASTDKYQQEMEIQDEIIHLNSPVKVFCTCESFKYEFANAVFRAGSLLKSINFVRSIISRPKEKNQYNVPSGCKHIVALARQVIKIKPKRG
ncbi:MAG TPA: hypothetical protein PKG96_07690 [Bacilli bacterium]|jgi:hypothetical protein|nr:hypothetical protein [Bacilli bacterium]HOH58902.1 hypothetical protein [Bacilli bacterium]HQM07577.1 hypothetical protein [Bacilli bacterium]